MVEVKPSQEIEEPIELLVERLDEQVPKEGIGISQAWRYREEVRHKYGLPESSWRWDDPIQYIEKIIELIKKHNIPLRYKHEFEQFFKDYPTARAAYLQGNLVVTAANDDWFILRAQANQLSHEVVHALQERYPRMPDEEAEREAYYYQMLTPDRIREYKHDPDYLHHYINTVIEESVASSCKTNQKI